MNAGLIENIATLFWSVSFCDTDLRRHKKLTKYFFKDASAPLLFASKKGQNSPRFSSSPYQRGGTTRVIFFLHLKNKREKAQKPLRFLGFPASYLFYLHNMVAEIGFEPMTFGL